MVLTPDATGGAWRNVRLPKGDPQLLVSCSSTTREGGETRDGVTSQRVEKRFDDSFLDRVQLKLVFLLSSTVVRQQRCEPKTTMHESAFGTTCQLGQDH